MRSYSDACSCEEEGGEAGREEDDEDRRRQEAGREEGCEEEVISSERSWGRLGRVAPIFERGARAAPFDSSFADRAAAVSPAQISSRGRNCAATLSGWRKFFCDRRYECPYDARNP
jgi:hypothetical protein